MASGNRQIAFNRAKVWQFKGSLIFGGLVTLFLLGTVGLLLMQLGLFPQEVTGRAAFFSARLISILSVTIFQASLSVALSLVIGVLLAWALSHQRAFFGRTVLITLLSSALILPTLVVVLGLVTVYGRSGWLNGFLDLVTGHSLGSFLFGLTGILMAHSYLNGSFAARTLLLRLEAIPVQKRKLARALGLSVWQRFRFLEWPVIAGSLPGLGVTIFLLCFTSFAIVLTLGGGPKFNTLEVAIFEAIKLDFDIGMALQLALVQLAICAVLVYFASGVRVQDKLVAVGREEMLWPEPVGVRAVQFGLISIFALFFVMPLAAVVVDGIRADFPRLLREPIVARSVLISLTLATISSVIALMVILGLALAKRSLRLSTRLNSAGLAKAADRVLSFSGTIVLAVPSLVLGLGFFLLALKWELTGPFWVGCVLVLANVLVSLPFGLALLGPALEKTGQRYDRLAFSLGISGLARWRLFEWVQLRDTIGYVFAICFCFSLGDLGVIALFGSSEFSTLPYLLYQKMSSYRTHDAAGVALILLVISLVMFFFAPKIFSMKIFERRGDA